MASADLRDGSLGRLLQSPREFDTRDPVVSDSDASVFVIHDSVTRGLSGSGDCSAGEWFDVALGLCS